MLVRKKFLDEVGPLDENFFAHMEEIDWCWRANLHGYKVFCLPQSVVYHVGGGTLPKLNPLKTFFNHRNNLIMLEKNLDLKTALILLPVRPILDIFSSFLYLIKGDISNFIAVLKAIFAFIIGQPKWIRKRIATRKNIKRKKLNNNIIYNGSIVLDYFIRGKRKFSELKF